MTIIAGSTAVDCYIDVISYPFWSDAPPPNFDTTTLNGEKECSSRSSTSRVRMGLLAPGGIFKGDHPPAAHIGRFLFYTIRSIQREKSKLFIHYKFGSIHCTN